MATTFHDDFERADGPVGNGWTVSQGAPVISSGQLFMGAGSGIIYRTPPVGQEIDLGVSVYTGPSISYPANTGFWLYVRATTNRQNGFGAFFGWGGTNQNLVRIERWQSNTSYNLATTYQVSFGSGAHIFAFLAIGTVFTAYVDGVPVLQVEDTWVSPGSVVGILSNASNALYFDDYFISDQVPNGMLAAPAQMRIGSEGNQVYLYGLGTAWTPGTPGDPEFTISSGAITAQTIETVDRAVLTIDAPLFATSAVITDPNYGRTVLVQFSASVYLQMGIGGLPFGLAIPDLISILLTVMSATGGGGGGIPADEWADIYATIGVKGLGDPTVVAFLQLIDTWRQDNKLYTAAEKAILAEDSLYDEVHAAQLETVDIDTLVRQLRTADHNWTLDDVKDWIDAISAAAIDYARILGDPETTTKDVKDDVISVVDGVGANVITNGNQISAIRTASLYTLGTLKTLLDALTSSGANDLQDILDAIAGISAPDLTAVLNAIAAVRGANNRDLTEVYNKVDAIPTNPITSLQPALDAISNLDADLVADVTTITNAIAAVRGNGNPDVAGVLTALQTIRGDYVTTLADLELKLDNLADAVAAVEGGGVAFPGDGAVTYGAPVAITTSMTIASALDGFVYNLTTIPSGLSARYIGDKETHKYLGWCAFYAPGGYVERFQSLSWNKGVVVPEGILHPGGVVIYWRPGTQGTVTPYTRD